MKKKILIFYISRHSGHYYAATAIEKGFIAAGREVQVEKINAFEYTNPILEKVINRVYLEIIKKKPEIWGNMYDNPEVIKKTKKAREILHKFNMSKIKKLIEGISPDVVYCTQAFPCGMVSDYKKYSGNRLTLIAVMTDHAPHSYWIHDQVNFYVTPSAAAASVFIEKGVESGKIREYGIPIDPKFRESHNPDIITGEMGLKRNMPTVLIMGGNQGLGAIEEVLMSFLEDKERVYQLLIVTGTNKKLFSRLRKICKKRKTGDNVRIFSFANNIDRLMEISDMIVTKAGGMTVAEALAKKLPIILVKPIPGHERMNANYLLKNGAAIEIRNYANIHTEISELFRTDGVLGRMRENIEKIAKPDSSMDIAELAYQNE